MALTLTLHIKTKSGSISAILFKIVIVFGGNGGQGGQGLKCPRAAVIRFACTFATQLILGCDHLTWRD